MSRPGVLVLLLAGLTLAGFVAGCRAVGAAAYYLGPRRIQKPQFEFEEGSKLAILVEAARPSQENPVFAEALCRRSRVMLREGGSKVQLVPYQRVFDLRRAHGDFKKWSLQRIGRELGADYVLYVRIEDLRIREPGSPILTPAVELRMKLIDVHQPAVHARVWPAGDEAWYAASCRRQTRAAADENPEAPDTAARKLACDTAYYVTMPFVTVDLEENPPVEP